MFCKANCCFMKFDDLFFLGTKKIFLLDSPPKLDQIQNETHEAMDFLCEPTLLPAKTTYYACSVFQIPSLPFKHHVVQVICFLQYHSRCTLKRW